MSRKRVGWKFVTAFQIANDRGTVLNLTDTSPAMLAYRLRTSWMQRNLKGARQSLKMDPDIGIDFEFSRKIMQDRILTSRVVSSFWGTFATRSGRRSGCTTSAMTCRRAASGVGTIGTTSTIGSSDAAAPRTCGANFWSQETWTSYRRTGTWSLAAKSCLGFLPRALQDSVIISTTATLLTGGLWVSTLRARCSTPTVSA